MLIAAVAGGDRTAAAESSRNAPGFWDDLSFAGDEYGFNASFAAKFSVSVVESLRFSGAVDWEFYIVKPHINSYFEAYFDKLGVFLAGCEFCLPVSPSK